MPFDAAPPAEVTARDRVIQLRDFLANLPQGKHFRMALFEDRCGTSACIAGWQGVLLQDRYRDSCNSYDETQKWISRIRDSLGLTEAQGADLFWGSITEDASDAVVILDHYLLTGKIDWRVAE